MLSQFVIVGAISNILIPSQKKWAYFQETVDKNDKPSKCFIFENQVNCIHFRSLAGIFT